MTEALLHPAVAGADDLRNGDGDGTHHEASDRRSGPSGQWRSLEQVGQAVEALGVEETDQPGKKADEGEPEQLDRVGEAVARHVPEERCEPLDRAEHHEADHRRDEAGQQRGRVEVVAVEDLRGQDGPTQGGAEDGPDARPDSRRHGDPAVSGFEIEDAGQERSEPGADLARRALSTAGATRSDGQGRRHDLDDHGTEPHATRIVVHRGDGGVGAVSLRLRSDAKDQDRAEQRTEPRL